MTTEELNTIVEAVVAELEKNGVDFDYKIEAPLDTDTIFVIRGTAPNYQGVTVTWKGLLDIITAQATQAKNDAETAKNAANTILEQVTSKESNISTMESNVSTMKTSVETTKGQVEILKGQTETAQQNAEESRDNAQRYMESAKQSAETSASNVERLENVDFRQKSTGKVILDVDVTGTMQGFMDGIEQEPYEAIALTLEPDVPTAESHNFGVRGQICIDGNYLYVCVADNTWKKIPLQEL